MIPEEQLLNARILIVDDNVLNVQVLKKILNDAGFNNITTTTDSTQTLRLFQKIIPDLLLLDFNMPNMNGLEVMAALAALNPRDYLPVLMLTAETSEDLQIRALQSGAKDFLKKPYDRLEVVLRSRNIIEVRLLYNQIKGQNQTLEQQVADRMEELHQTRLDVIVRLARVAEYRDVETGAHIIRMSRYAASLAKAVGYTPAQCDLILNTSPLHDIGKIAIPDSILLKPDKLESHEYEIMKNHTIIGAQILSGGNSVFLSTAEAIAMNHHEKFDGTGYPNGLREMTIPLVGRICAVADVFDALTSIRPYKKAWSVQDALTEIQKCSGSHFDPKLVEAFMDIRKDILYIYDAYQ